LKLRCDRRHHKEPVIFIKFGFGFNVKENVEIVIDARKKVGSDINVEKTGLVTWGGVRLSPRGMSDTIGPIVPAPDDG
jgi:hypothetical protein